MVLPGATCEGDVAVRADQYETVAVASMKTVLLDGRRVVACLTPAVTAEGAAVTIVEGPAGEGELPPLQRAFIALDGFPCGYRTSGQLSARRSGCWPSTRRAGPARSPPTCPRTAPRRRWTRRTSVTR
ncbi:hypothetical protein [Nonomuraea sp. NPDC001699]